METPRYSIDHIHYRTLDPEAAAAFWRDVFGATEKGRVVNNGRLRVMFDLGGLAIFVEEVPAGTPATPPPAFLGLEHLALSVTDMVDRYTRDLQAALRRIWQDFCASAGG